MLRDEPEVPSPALLLVGAAEAWRDAAAEAARRLGRGLVSAETADEAVEHLVSAPRRFTHVLLPAGARHGVPDLLGLTVGEAHSGTGLILLGADDADRSDLPSEVSRVPRPDAEGLVAVLGPAAPLVGHAPLSPADLLRALEAEQFEIRFQPMVRLGDRRPTGVEALARMRYPYRRTLPPVDFVPQIEHAGLAVRLAEATGATALRSLPPGFVAGELSLSLNFALSAFVVRDAMERLDRHRGDVGLEAGRVVIELTESEPVRDIAAVALAADRWRRAGYRLAIDDAGPDVGNLPALYRLPFSMVKLDKGLVRRSVTEAAADTFLRRTIRLAHGRGLDVVAEGVETQADWDRMAALGVDQVQGFLMTRALPPGALPAWLRAWGDQFRFSDQTSR